MQDINQKILSIEKLNVVLNTSPLKFLGQFSSVNISFIAGLLLDYETRKNDNWEKIRVKYFLVDSKEGFEIRQCFQQYKELYGVDWKDVFAEFSYALQTDKAKKPDIFSKSFAPILHITKDTINHFFAHKQIESNTQLDKCNDILKKSIETVKEAYITTFSVLDFIDKRTKYYLKHETDFVDYEEFIKKILKNSTPIFTFVFIIASKNLAEKKKESFSNRKDYIEKLSLFAQDYERGLYELAKNIVEHSGENGEKGKGMITIRAYNKNNTDTLRVLETNVFDYGNKGIVPKLIEYTNIKATQDNIRNTKIKQCYIDDNTFFTESKNYKLIDYIDNGKKLQQQQFRHTSHYGISKFHKLIENPLKGEVFVTSQGIITRDYYGNNAKEMTLTKGTHYYFKIPFLENNFKNIVAKPFFQDNQTAILGETASLEFIQNIQKIQIKLNQLPEIPQETENVLIDITIDCEEITKENIDGIYNSFNKLLELSDNNRIAINSQNKIKDASILLRFLSYLTWEYKQPFIIYNISYQTYKELLKDNKDFYESRESNSESYWHKERGMLLFLKEEIKVEKIGNVQQFYFADILWGQSIEEFLYINMKVNNTFPNTITLSQEITDNEKSTKSEYLQKINSNQNLQQFFFPKSNNLLPFDALLGDECNPLFVSNLTTILQNSLFNRAKKYHDLKEYIKNFEGFHIGETHFRIGSKIHSEDFYYAKRLFQNSFFTTRLAMLLAINIKNKIKNLDQDITLVGYEMYSELLLSLIEKFLKNFGAKDERINHFIMQTEDVNFKYLPDSTFKKFINEYKNRQTIIIVPIAATGSTIRKVENDLREEMFKYEKKENKKSEQEAKKLVYEYTFFEYRYNILLAEDPDNIKFEKIKIVDAKQKSIIILPAKWHEIRSCPLCYGEIFEKDKILETKTLFETDKSSLTPAIIFENPKGKEITEEERKKFDEIDFKESLKYKKVFRNNKYRIFYIETDKFIEINLPKVKKWLDKEVKDQIGLESSDKVVIVAPCHESNSRFLNIVNEFVFSSSATIIHYQNNTDFAENFKLLNKSYLTKETKLFYVDDSLITGQHFFETLSLLEDLSLTFTASIILKNKSDSYTNLKIRELSNSIFSFTNFNQPSALNLLEQRPLEHERQRYETLAKTVLHDITIVNFQNKADSLNPLKLNKKKYENKYKDNDKKLRRLKNFEATHKIYDYFANNKDKQYYDIEKIISFKEYISDISLNLFPEYTQDEEREKIEERKDNQKALLKVLSQYPFNLYKPLREKTFDWLKSWIKQIVIPNTNAFKKTDYDNFQTIKFLLRRASLLGDYQVLGKVFLRKISHWFIKIDKYFKEKDYTYKNDKQLFVELNENEEENLQDFPIFVLRNYVEMIQKNGWVAYIILKEIDELVSDLHQSKQGSQFVNMLQIESALVIDDFYGMIIKERRIEWRNIFKEDTKFIVQTEKIRKFFEFERNTSLINSNKYQIVKETFLNDSDEWIESNAPFGNYLWIKQLIFVDCDKSSHFPKDVDYQEKIDAIVGKMKDFFPKNKIQAFFVVTDGKQKPYVLKEEQGLLCFFNEEFETDKQIKDLTEEINLLELQKDSINRKTLDKKKAYKEQLELKKKKHKTQVLIDFLNGIDCNTYIAPETTAEFYRNYSDKEIFEKFDHASENKISNAVIQDLFSNPSPNYELAQWKDAYKKEVSNLSFMPENSKWLFLIRISKNNGRDKYESLGLLGFYSSENWYNSSEILLPKQLLMLLRQDMGNFIENHHKNDEFAGLIQQKQKADYQFMLRHGIDEYKNPIKNYFEKIYALIPNKNEESEKLKRFYDFELNHLTNKIDLMQKFNEFDPENPNHFDTFNLKTIIDTFNDNIEYVLKFERTNLYYLDYNDNIDDYIEIIDNTKDKFDSLSEEIEFPHSIIDEMIFELIFNIRKHVLNKYSGYIKQNKLIISLDFLKNNNILYFRISNNYCEKKAIDFNCIYNFNKLDGLNLINCILKKAKIGVLKVTKTESSELKDKIVSIDVPLKNLNR